jgi:hypothetical protein
MNIKKLVVEFGTVFAVTLIITALVTITWNLIGHGERGDQFPLRDDFRHHPDMGKVTRTHRKVRNIIWKFPLDSNWQTC